MVNVKVINFEIKVKPIGRESIADMELELQLKKLIEFIFADYLDKGKYSDELEAIMKNNNRFV